ncbi:unnamed protein product [Cyprideis torosa]|uniref:Uncharacterized protein n=1 Tax=Cyprideis torosa TaxID=163714 RepID=A0A7R8WT42_9CRUS|nr:unnamed protein product [Cyprideis torosa]CAG0908161.1 unnamed protein product [Cyprideis torosa]
MSPRRSQAPSRQTRNRMSRPRMRVRRL